MFLNDLKISFLVSTLTGAVTVKPQANTLMCITHTQYLHIDGLSQPP